MSAQDERNERLYAEMHRAKQELDLLRQEAERLRVRTAMLDAAVRVGQNALARAAGVIEAARRVRWEPIKGDASPAFVAALADLDTALGVYDESIRDGAA